MKKYKKYKNIKKMLTSVYDAHKNKNNKNNDKRVISITQLCLSAVLKMKNYQSVCVGNKDCCMHYIC